MKRSKWKGIYFSLHTKIFDDLKKTKHILPVPRRLSIIPKFIGLTFKVYNGKNFKEIIIKEEMVGFKFGEFVKTRSDFVFKKKKKKKKT